MGQRYTINFSIIVDKWSAGAVIKMLNYIIKQNCYRNSQISASIQDTMDWDKFIWRSSDLLSWVEEQEWYGSPNYNISDKHEQYQINPVDKDVIPYPYNDIIIYDDDSLLVNRYCHPEDDRDIFEFDKSYYISKDDFFKVVKILTPNVTSEEYSNIKKAFSKDFKDFKDDYPVHYETIDGETKPVYRGLRLIMPIKDITQYPEIKDFNRAKYVYDWDDSGLFSANTEKIEKEELDYEEFYQNNGNSIIK